MDAAVWGFVGTLAGAALGAAASIATTVAADRNAAALQAQADQLDRSERSRAFQRENLLAVQEALQDLARLTGRAHHEDLVAHRNGAPWGRTLLTAEVDEGLGLAHRRLTALIEWVSDDSLRSELKDLHSEFTWQTMVGSEAEAEARMRGTTDAFDEVMSHLGAVLRAHY